MQQYAAGRRRGDRVLQLPLGVNQYKVRIRHHSVALQQLVVAVEVQPGPIVLLPTLGVLQEVVHLLELSVATHAHKLHILILGIHAVLKVSHRLYLRHAVGVAHPHKGKVHPLALHAVEAHRPLLHIRQRERRHFRPLLMLPQTCSQPLCQLLMLRKLALRPYHLYHSHHLTTLIVAVLIVCLLHRLQRHQFPHLLIPQQRICPQRVEQHLHVQRIHPIPYLPSRYLVGALRHRVGKQRSKECHIIVVVVQDRLPLDVFIHHLAPCAEMQAIAHTCQLIALVAVEELILCVGSLLGHHQLQAVEIAFLRSEAGIKIDAVPVDIVRHHRLKVRYQPIQLVRWHIHKLQRQHFGTQKHVLLLVQVPVKPWHIHLVVPPRLHKERLAVVLYLHYHHGGIISIGLQLKRAVRPYHRMVHHHLGTCQHIAIAV